jgi:hypothetical protein
MAETIDINGDGDGDSDGEDLRSGLVTLVLALVEIVDEALEREAVRRMESGELTDEEIERLGTQLARIDEELRAMEEREGVAEEVDRLRQELNDTVEDALREFTEEEL